MIPQNPRPEQPVLGCDVAARTITIFDSQTSEIRDIDNTPRQIKALVRQYPAHRLACEVTGGYETKLVQIAHGHGLTVYRLHPSRISAFVKACGQNAKTDPLDARAIADYIRLYGPALTPFVPPKPADKALLQLSRRRDDLVRMRTAETNRAKAPDMAAARASIQAVIRVLSREIKAIETRMAALIARDEAQARRYDVLCAMPGIGAVTATALIARLPELGHLTGKQIAALTGLAPYARQSGARDGYRRTGRGRHDIKRIMFMAALSAVRFNPVIKRFYDRLIKNGKQPMLALIASARKLIVIANAKLRDS